MGAARSNSRQRPCLVRYLAPQRGTKAGAPASSLLLAEIKFPIINATTRYECYAFYEGALTIAAVNRETEVYEHDYNDYRPHDGIGVGNAHALLSTTRADGLICLTGTKPEHFIFVHQHHANMG